MAAAGSAFAADMAVRSAPPAYPAAPPAYSAYDWGGAYIGGVIGGAWGETDSSDPNFGVLGARVGVPVVQPTFSSGFIGGVEGGMRYQLGKLVVGTEADITWGSVNGTSTTNWVPLGVLSRSISADTNWIATATSSIGIAHNSWLIYTKAGVAYAHTNYTDNWVGGGIPLFTGADSENRVGWTVGAGVEWAILEQLVGQGRIRLSGLRQPDRGHQRHRPSRHRQFSGVVRHGERATNQPIQGWFELAHPPKFLVRTNFSQSSRVGRGRRRGADRYCVWRTLIARQSSAISEGLHRATQGEATS